MVERTFFEFNFSGKLLFKIKEIVQSLKPTRKVIMDKIWIKMCLVPLEAQFYVLLPAKNPLKSEKGKISCKNVL